MQKDVRCLLCQGSSPGWAETARGFGGRLNLYWGNRARSILQSTITSTRNAIFTTAKTSNSTVPPP